MDEIRRLLKNLQDRIQNLEKGIFIKKLTIPSDGFIVIKVVASDPVAPVNNEIWINSSTNYLKWNKNGVIKSVLLS